MTLLVDDRCLSAHLRGTAVEDEPVFTTGLWYFRLCQAVLGPGSVSGKLSGPIASLPSTQRAAALRSLLELPEHIGLLSLRDLSPAMAQLRNRHKLNLLNIEALAAANKLNAKVVLTSDSPALQAALDDEGLAWERRPAA